MLKPLLLSLGLAAAPLLAQASPAPVFATAAPFASTTDAYADYDPVFDLFYAEAEVALASGQLAELVIFGGLDAAGPWGAMFELEASAPDLSVSASLSRVTLQDQVLELLFKADPLSGPGVPGTLVVTIDTGLADPLGGFAGSGFALAASAAPAPVPLPAGGALLLWAMGGLLALRRTV